MNEDLIKEYEALSEIARKRKTIESEFRIRMYALVKHMPLMRKETFYACVEILRRNLHSKKLAHYGYNTKSALHNARLEIFSEKEKNPLTDGPLYVTNAYLNGEQNKKIFLIAFQLMWAKESTDLARAVDKMGSAGSRGDDAFGDYADALPLLGLSITTKIRSHQYKTEAEIESDFRTWCTMKHPSKNINLVRDDALHMLNTVFAGENYFRSAIEESAAQHFVDATMVLVEQPKGYQMLSIKIGEEIGGHWTLEMEDAEGNKVDTDIDNYDLLLKHITEFIAANNPDQTKLFDWEQSATS